MRWHSVTLACALGLGDGVVVAAELPPPPPLPAVMAKERVTFEAALKLLVDAADAVVVHVPVETNAMVKPVTVHTDAVLEVRVTVLPVAFVVGATVRVPVVKV